MSVTCHLLHAHIPIIIKDYIVILATCNDTCRRGKYRHVTTFPSCIFCFMSRTLSSSKFWIKIIFPFLFSDKVPTLPLQSWYLECQMFEGEKVADPIPSLYGKDHAASLAAISSISKRAFAVYQRLVRALQSVISLNIFIADYLCLFTYIFCSLALLNFIYIYCRPALFNYLYLWQSSSV